MNPHEIRVATMLGAICRYWRRRELQTWAASGAAGLLAWLLAMVLLDNAFMLRSAGLLLGWAALSTAAIAAVVVLIYRLTLTRPAADRLALMYEARVPGQRNRLINAVQFVAARSLRSDPLVQLAITENAAALDLRAAPRAIDVRPVRRAFLALAAVAAILLADAALRPAWTLNALTRVFQPVDPPPHLLATDPAVRPGDTEVIEGAPLTIAADVPPLPIGGGPPRDVTLEYRLGPAGWMPAAMQPGAKLAAPPHGTALRSDAPSPNSTSFSYTFSAVWHSFDHRIHAGRSLSPEYHVAVRPRPCVSTLQITVTRPAYAGGEPRVLKPGVGDVSALSGSTIAVNLTALTALAAGQLEFSDGSSVPLDIGICGAGSKPAPQNERTCAAAQFKLDRSGNYSIRLTDPNGLANLNPPRYTLTAEPDQAPVVAITRPGRDLILPANSTLDLKIEAEDDIGLARVVLQVKRSSGAPAGSQPSADNSGGAPATRRTSDSQPSAAPAGEWTDFREFTFAAGAARRQTMDAQLALPQLGVQLNDVLLYRAVAFDRRAPQPNVGIDRTYSIGVAQSDDGGAALAAQTKRLLDALQQILALQRENRTAFDMDQPPDPIRVRQQDIRDRTTQTIDNERKALRPNPGAIEELTALVDGPLLKATELLAGFGGQYQQRFKLKPPILQRMDEIIRRLEALIAKLAALLQHAEKAQQILQQMPEKERAQALKDIRDMLEKLRDFAAEQDRVIKDTDELARKAPDFTDADKQQIDQLKGTEDKWGQVFTGSTQDIQKLTEQGFADRSIANDYKEMVEQIEEASKNLTPTLIQLAVPREQSGRELAQQLAEEMEMWLPNSPDHVQWIMEEPLDTPEIPMVDLPDELSDLIGDLIDQEDELNEAAQDMTSAWADSISAAGWEVSDGPISNFSAVGKTGNQLPNNNELSGRAGEGRSGRSQGQLVQDVARGLDGRRTPTRITNDAYEQGVVRELQQMATGGATGGGKARGAGQEGLQGESPPPNYKDLKYMQDWQQRIRQEAQRVAGQLQVVHISLPSLERAIRLMQQAEQAGKEGRYRDMFRIQQMVLHSLRLMGDTATREMALRVDRAAQLPPEQRRQILDAMDEPVPEEYRAAVQRYFEQLSEAK